MNVLKFNLLDKETEYGFMPTLTAYILDGNPNEKESRPAVLVIPGGGYGHVSYREGERIALSYSSAGFHTFILNYCVKPHCHPLPILNAAEAMKLIRINADEWGIDSDKIASSVISTDFAAFLTTTVDSSDSNTTGTSATPSAKS